MDRLRDPFGRSGKDADPSLRDRATGAIRDHTSRHEAIFERAARLHGKAERLRAAGTPSESARNKAERAGAEAVEGLAALRTRFAASTGEEGRRVFDEELALRYPGVSLPGSPGT